MRFRRVLLVNPPSDGEWKGLRPHIGLGYIAEWLVAHGIEYDVIDMNLGHGVKGLKRKIQTFQPDLIGMSLLTMQYKLFYSILADIKREFPNVPIVVGGPHVTIMRDRVLRECPAIDYGVVHEGEHTLLELCQGDDPAGILGLLRREGDDVAYLGDRPFEMDLDTLPWPRYERFELSRYIPEAEIYSSRGCPHDCIFCPNRLISPVYRSRSAEKVVEEMAYWYAKGHRQFNFDDDNFNMNRERVFDICDGIEAAGLKDVTIRCSNGIRADRCDREMLARMKEVGFRYLAFGADAGNNRMLEIVKKGETIEQIEEAVKAATDLGYDVKLLFVVGTPYETREDVEDKVRLSRRYPVQDAHFYNIIPYPGTELFDWIGENKLFLKDPEEYLNDVSCLENTPVFETPELRAKDRIELYRYLEGVRGQLHKQAALRLYGPSLLGSVAGAIASSSLFRRIFYGSFFVRRTVDRARYRKRPDSPAEAAAAGTERDAG